MHRRGSHSTAKVPVGEISNMSDLGHIANSTAIYGHIDQRNQ